MAIVYPLAVPTTPGFSSVVWKPITVVGESVAPTSLQAQTFVWPGQAWALSATLPKVHTRESADTWTAFLLAMNGKEGRCLLGDRTRPTTRGDAAGAKTVGAGAVALSTTLPVAGGTGAFVIGDWLQIGDYLHNVTQVNSAVSYDVWPRLRGAYVNGTVIIYTNAKGKFKFVSNDVMQWAIDKMKHYDVELDLVEAL